MLPAQTTLARRATHAARQHGEQCRPHLRHLAGAHLVREQVGDHPTGTLRQVRPSGDTRLDQCVGQFTWRQRPPSCEQGAEHGTTEQEPGDRERFHAVTGYNARAKPESGRTICDAVHVA
jgi:hypothetical protein